MRLYPIRWGRYYSGFEQVGETLRSTSSRRRSSPRRPAWLSFAVLAAIVVLPGLVLEERRPERDAACSFGRVSPLPHLLPRPHHAAGPDDRFVAVPLVLAFLALLRGRRRARGPGRPGGGFARLVVPATVGAVRGFRFVPIENWGDLARFVD